MLKGKNILLAVCGGIAVYKVVDVASRLRKLGANVHVVMTKEATNFVTPLTFVTGTVTATLVGSIFISTVDPPFTDSIDNVKGIPSDTSMRSESPEFKTAFKFAPVTNLEDVSVFLPAVTIFESHCTADSISDVTSVPAL